MPNENMLNQRFRGFLPVVIDIETSGVYPEQNALLEICAVFINMDEKGVFHKGEHIYEHILPFEGSRLDAASLEFNNIDPYQPLRFAVPENEALEKLFSLVSKKIRETNCSRAVLVGHNAWFDLLFLKAATERCELKSPFHSFTCFDTATLAGLVYKQTVLSKAMTAAGIKFDSNEAHSAIYDANKTAELFCTILNTWQELQI